MDCASITSLRTGAAAAVSAQALARDDARTVGVARLRRQRGVGGPLPRAAPATARPFAHDPRPEPAEALAEELGWEHRRSGRRPPASDVVVTVTPAAATVIGVGDLRAGQHLAVLGADAHGKAEVELGALERCRLFCDEWEQASKGGELAGRRSRAPTS